MFSSPWFPSVFSFFSLFFLLFSSSSLLVSNLRSEQGRITGRISRYCTRFFTVLLLPLNNLFTLESEHLNGASWVFSVLGPHFLLQKKVNVNGLIIIMGANKQMTQILCAFTSIPLLTNLSFIRPKDGSIETNLFAKLQISKLF